MKLIKLLYLVDRSSLIRFGRPITFDLYFSLPHGPVLSFTLNRINEEVDPQAPSYWHRFISQREGHTVRLLGDMPNHDLSTAEEELIDEVFSKFGGMSRWRLRDYCHELPEWQDRHGSIAVAAAVSLESLPIEIRDILLAEGLDEEEVNEILTGLRAEAAAGTLLG